MYYSLQLFNPGISAKDMNIISPSSPTIGIVSKGIIHCLAFFCSMSSVMITELGIQIIIKNWNRDLVGLHWNSKRLMYCEGKNILGGY